MTPETGPTRKDHIKTYHEFSLIGDPIRLPNHYVVSYVGIPKDAPFFIEFTKPRNSIQFTMEPTTDNPNVWQVTGQITIDIIQQLNLPITSPRRGATPPTLTGSDLEAARAYGLVDPVSNTSFMVDILLGQSKIASLLRSVVGEEHTASMKLKVSPEYGERIIPQKEKPATKNTSLVVHKGSTRSKD